MAHVGTLRNHRFEGVETADDIRGSKIYGRDDDKLGTIDDIIFDHETGDIRYAVVDTGGMFSHKQFLVPADQIRPRGDKDDDYRVNLSKSEIEGLPRYNESDVRDRDRWDKYEKDYHGASDQYFASSDVLHRADSPNIITDPNMPATGTGGDLGNVDTRIRGVASDSTAGPMNTMPTAWGQHQDTRRLETRVDNAPTKPDLDTAYVSPSEEGIGRKDVRRADTNTSNARRENRLDLTNDTNRVQSTSFNTEGDSFLDSDVGATSRSADRLEKRHMQRDQEEYVQSRRNEAIPGEYVGTESSVSGTIVSDRTGNRTGGVSANAPNTNDSEYRTAEGDSIYNVADPQESGVRSRAYESDSGVTPELRNIREQQDRDRLSSRVGNRWDRFQDRLRADRDRISGSCDVCSRERNKAA